MTKKTTQAQHADTLREFAANTLYERPNQYAAALRAGADAIDALELLALPVSEITVSPDDHLDIYAPGEWRCPQCNFYLSTMTMDLQAGDIGVSAHDVYHGEPCPNDGTPMVKVTWRERATDNYTAYVKLVDDICAAAGAPHLPAAFEQIKSARALTPPDRSQP